MQSSAIKGLITVMGPVEFQKWLHQKDQVIKQEVDNTEDLIPAKDGIKVTEADFDPIKVQGRGAFGKVILTIKKDTKELYEIYHS